MTDETLQSDAEEVVTDEIIQNEIQDQSQSETETSDLAPESEKTEQINQEAINKAINKKHFEKMQALRERDAALARLAQLEQQIPKNDIVVPELPDPYDDNYRQKMQEREAIIAYKAVMDAQKAQMEAQRVYNRQIEQQKQYQQLEHSVKSYTDKAKSYGISEAELAAAGQAVADYGISNDLTIAILNDSDGALITRYLASNPAEIEALNSLNPYGQAIYIERNIRGKATALKPKHSNAPKPPTMVDGRGVDPILGKYPLLKGAKFE